jgi:hypothetical protein
MTRRRCAPRPNSYGVRWLCCKRKPTGSAGWRGMVIVDAVPVMVRSYRPREPAMVPSGNQPAAPGEDEQGH